MAATKIQTNFRVRHSFGKIERILEVPNLIDIQKRSYDKFLQSTVPIDERDEMGLQSVFKSVFPIKDFNGTSELQFKGYTLERPKYDVDECRQRVHEWVEEFVSVSPIKLTDLRGVFVYFPAPLPFSLLVRRKSARCRRPRQVCGRRGDDHPLQCEPDHQAGRAVSPVGGHRHEPGHGASPRGQQSFFPLFCG